MNSIPAYRITYRDNTIQERFERFLQLHPDVYAEFKRIAQDLLSRGILHYGAKAIMEIVRYHRVVGGQDAQEPFKINNNYSSRLARKLIEEDERFDGFFLLRELKSA